MSSLFCLYIHQQNNIKELLFPLKRKKKCLGSVFSHRIKYLKNFLKTVFVKNTLFKTGREINTGSITPKRE